MSNLITLKKYAVSYLSKYNTSKKNLNRILRKKVGRMALEKNDKFFLNNSIDSIIADLEKNKFIDDKNFTYLKIKNLSLRGKSKNFIKSYLLNKGIKENLIEMTFENFELMNPNWEENSAKIFARKKKLGIKHSNNFEKDLAKMYRAGFNYSLSKKTLKF